MHGAGDAVIPFSEVVRLVQAGDSVATGYDRTGLKSLRLRAGSSATSFREARFTVTIGYRNESNSIAMSGRFCRISARIVTGPIKLSGRPTSDSIHKRVP